METLVVCFVSRNSLLKKMMSFIYKTALCRSSIYNLFVFINIIPMGPDHHYRKSSFCCCVVSHQRVQSSQRPSLKNKPVICCLSGVWGKMVHVDLTNFLLGTTQTTQCLPGYTGIFTTRKVYWEFHKWAMWRGNPNPNLRIRGQANKALWQAMRNRNVSLKCLCNEVKLLFGYYLVFVWWINVKMTWLVVYFHIYQVVLLFSVLYDKLIILN